MKWSRANRIKWLKSWTNNWYHQDSSIFSNYSQTMQIYEVVAWVENEEKSPMQTAVYSGKSGI